MIASVCTEKKLRRRQYLLQEGDIWRYYAFVLTGCLRTYRIDDDGVEHILNFSLENDWPGDRISRHSGQPSQYNIDALENSRVLLIPKKDFENLLKKVPAFVILMDKIQDRIIADLENRLYATLSYSAEKKYQNFKTTYPDLINRVPQRMIASFLGISAETLSRIKKQNLSK